MQRRLTDDPWNNVFAKIQNDADIIIIVFVFMKYKGLSTVYDATWQNNESHKNYLAYSSDIF